MVIDRERAVEMIRKLVALAEGTPYEQEAASAMAKAEELLKRHGLAMAQCRAKPQGCKTRERPSMFSNVPQWLGDCFAGIAAVFDCAPITSRRWELERGRWETTFVFVGQPEDVELADFLFEMAWKAINAHLKVAKVKHESAWKIISANIKAAKGKRRFERDYAIGVAAGVMRQIRAMRPVAQEESGLVLHKEAELKKFLKDHFDMRWDGMRYKVGDYDPAVAAAGAKVGMNLQLTMGIKDTGAPTPQALGQAALALGV